ncbi:MAG: Mur ligase family protein, partial [Treponema sp.]|nr:Mur ligase family protein [Treponema sp.]
EVSRAIDNGAEVIVHDNDQIIKKNGVVYLKVKNARFAMSPISAAFYNFPSKNLFITGVTGAEGKSTTVYLIWQLLSMMGKKAGFISTGHICLGNEVIKNNEFHTTPEAPVIQRLLCEMADNGCEYAILEASTHGLSIKTNRLGDVDFCSGVLTNLAHEYENWEQYRDDKANLFRAVNRYTPPLNSSFIGPFGVVNADDKNSRYFIKLMKHKTFTYSPAGRDGDIILEAIESTALGNWYMVMIPALKERIELRDKLPGAFNSANVLASLLAVSGLLKLPLCEIASYVKKLKPLSIRD